MRLPLILLGAFIGGVTASLIPEKKKSTTIISIVKKEPEPIVETPPAIVPEPIVKEGE